MTFLPIVERELRVAARRRSTGWTRVAAALVGLVIAAGFMIMSLAVGIGTSRVGSGMFGTLTWLSLAATLAAGLFFTADSLSQEKREGTLGFLFLTDLRGHDVVGGKLVATSVRAASALLAVFPILAITLLMGGVTAPQFWKSALALLNALFCSLTAGLFISSVCRDSQRALGGTFLLVLAMCAGGPIIDAILAGYKGTGFIPLGSLVSPAYVFWAASAWGKTAYWPGLLASHLVGWCWFGLACLLVPRTWQDRATKAASSMTRRASSRNNGKAPGGEARRSPLLEQNPVMWLAVRERWQRVVLWLLVLLVIGPFLVFVLTLPSMVSVVWAQVSWLVLAMLNLWAASQASRFFLDARKSGLLELILVTPLTSKDIVLGQWRALFRLFFLPVLLLVLVQVAATVFSQNAAMGTFGRSMGAFSNSLLFSLVSTAAGALSTVANMAALMWFGMWMGLISGTGSTATLKTVLFVLVLPWMGITFFSTTMAGLLMVPRMLRGSPSNTVVLGFPFIMAGLSVLLTLAKDAAFFVWSRNRLFSQFRVEALRVLMRAGKTVLPGPLVATSTPPPLPLSR